MKQKRGQALVFLHLIAPATAFDWTLLGAGNQYTSFVTTLTVPPVPQRPATGDATYFYWPGLQTNSAANNYNPIGFGVIQPVLSFGPSCTPNQPAGASVYRGWYVSAQYVNPQGTVANHKGCQGGNMMDVQPGDALIMSMVLQDTTWIQTVTRQNLPCSGLGSGVNSPQGCQVSYSLDMQGQGQNRAELVLELYYQAVVTSNVVFSNIKMTISSPEPSSSTRFCTASSRLQKSETCTGMSLSDDGMTCTIQQCLFTATAQSETPASKSGTTGGVDANGNPISSSNVITAPPPPPPPADTQAPDPTKSGTDPSTTSVPAGEGLANNAIFPSTSGTTNSTSSSTNKVALFGGIAAAGVVLAVAGVVFLRYRNSHTKTTPDKLPLRESPSQELPVESPILVLDPAHQRHQLYETFAPAPKSSSKVAEDEHIAGLAASSQNSRLAVSNSSRNLGLPSKTSRNQLTSSNGVNVVEIASSIVASSFPLVNTSETGGPSIPSTTTPTSSSNNRRHSRLSTPLQDAAPPKRRGPPSSSNSRRPSEGDLNAYSNTPRIGISSSNIRSPTDATSSPNIRSPTVESPGAGVVAITTESVVIPPRSLNSRRESVVDIPPRSAFGSRRESVTAVAPTALDIANTSTDAASNNPCTPSTSGDAIINESEAIIPPRSSAVDGSVSIPPRSTDARRESVEIPIRSALASKKGSDLADMVPVRGDSRTGRE